MSYKYRKRETNTSAYFEKNYMRIVWDFATRNDLEAYFPVGRKATSHFTFFWRLCRLKMDSKFQLRLVPELADLNNHKKTLYFVSLSSFPPRILLKMIKIFPFLSHPKESPRWSFSRRRKLCKATSEQPSPTLSSKSLPISTTLHKGWNYFWNEKFNEPTAAAIAYGLDKKGCWQT